MAEVKLGFFEQCPDCHHQTYYPFSDGWMCIQPGCERSGEVPEEGVLPDRVVEAAQVEPPMSKNQRRKANKRARAEGQTTP